VTRNSAPADTSQLRVAQGLAVLVGPPRHIFIDDLPARSQAEAMPFCPIDLWLKNGSRRSVMFKGSPNARDIPSANERMIDLVFGFPTAVK